MRRRRRRAEADNELRWLTTYGDVVTLMLTFFVMLYAISQVNEQKFQQLVEGLAEPFGNQAAKKSVLIAGDALVGDLSEISPEFDPSNLDAPVRVGEVAEEPEPAPETVDEPSVSSPEEVKKLAEEIAASFEEAGIPNALSVSTDERGLVISLATDDVLFETGSAKMSARGREIIAVLAPTLLGLGNEILVEGHTDTVPLNRAGYTNWNLSVERALAVLVLLADVHGVDPTRLAATGYGEYRPVAVNTSEEGRAANRRVEIVIVVEKGAQDG